MSGPHLEQRAAELRAAFDRAFAQPREREQLPTVDLLAIRIGGRPYAVRLSEVGGLFADRRVTPVPSPAPAVTGIVSFRGAIHTVFDLRVVLRHPTGAPARWLIALADRPAAFAFDGFDAYLRLETRQVIDEVAHSLEPRPVLKLSSLFEAQSMKGP